MEDDSDVPSSVPSCPEPEPRKLRFGGQAPRFARIIPFLQDVNTPPRKGPRKRDLRSVLKNVILLLYLYSRNQ